VPVTGQDYDDDDEQSASSEPPWHNRTPAVVGATILGVLAIAVVIYAISFVARQFNTPEQAPLNFVDPSFSATTSRSGTPTTTGTITSTSPPQTTDLNPGDATSSSSSSRESTSRHDDEDDDDTSTTRTTRRKPRTNVTRTFDPYP
jgi:hypothetical protein